MQSALHIASVNIKANVLANLCSHLAFVCDTVNSMPDMKIAIDTPVNGVEDNTGVHLHTIRRIKTAMATNAEPLNKYSALITQNVSSDYLVNWPI